MKKIVTWIRWEASWRWWSIRAPHTNGWRHWIGWQLRSLADDIDRRHAPRRTGLSFTFEPGLGCVVWPADVDRGCPMWYLSDEDYERSHSEAGAAVDNQELRAVRLGTETIVYVRRTER